MFSCSDFSARLPGAPPLTSGWPVLLSLSHANHPDRSACLAASLPYLPSPSLSLKGSPVTGWPDEVMAGSPQRVAFVSRAQPILSGVRFYVTCCGPLSLTKFTSFDSPTWEPSPSLWAPWIGRRCSLPLPMLFCRCRPTFCRDGPKPDSSISCSWHSAWGPQYFQGAHKNGLISFKIRRKKLI